MADHHHRGAPQQQQPNSRMYSSSGQNSQQFIQQQQPSFPPPPQDGRFMHWGPPEYGMYPPPPHVQQQQLQGNHHPIHHHPHGPPPMHGFHHHHPHAPPPPSHYHGMIAQRHHHHHHQPPHHPPPGYHHNGGYGLPPPPPPHHPSHLHHHPTASDQFLYHHRPVPSLDDEDDGGLVAAAAAVDDDNDSMHSSNMDPIELLHPDQNLLITPPDTLPPLPQSVSELDGSPNTTNNSNGLPQAQQEQKESPHNNRVVTSPTTQQQQQDQTSSIEDITTVITKDEDAQPTSQMQQQDQGNDASTQQNNSNAFVEEFFGAPHDGEDDDDDEENTAVGHHKFNLYPSKSLDSTDLCLQSLGKDAETSNFETLDDDEALFLNNYANNNNNSSILSSYSVTGEQQQHAQQQHGKQPDDQVLGGENRYEIMNKAGAFPMPSRPDENKPPPHQHPGGTPHHYGAMVQPQRFAVMSPITMCFNRMLGAAEYIKTPGSANPKRRHVNASKVLPIVYEQQQQPQQQQVEKKRPFIEQPNPFDELANDPELERLVILQMAMQRQQHGNPYHPHGNAEKNVPAPAPRSQVISEGFFWREYPACEQVLYKHMRRYYEISAIQRNYKVQQAFNNLLVEQVRKAAVENGFQIDPNFDDKKLRDRIRCFYKTHLQNAKKRLATLQKHSDLPDNRSLVAVFIRCVRNPGLTLEASLNMAMDDDVESDADNNNNTDNEGPVKKQRRLDKVEKLKLSVKLHEASGKQTPNEGTTTTGA